MNKKVFNWMLMAALICGLSASVTSCKDDDDEVKPSAQEQLNDQATEFWAVVGQLVGGDQACDDYATKTFQPTIGEEKSGNATVRIVATNDQEGAAESFASLVGLSTSDVTAETPSYTWKNDAVGTLTYTKSQDGQSLATVDVSIAQVPGLRQIVYMTPEQMGQNANYTTCYYRFGDVITILRNDNVREFWICVCPSFEPEGKTTSHWVSVSPLRTQNIKSYTSSHGSEYNLPTNLTVNAEQNRNFAETLFAILNPTQWEGNVTRNNGPKMFKDFKKDKIMYHSAEFWKRVAEGWSKTKKYRMDNLWQLIFADSEDNMRSALSANGSGLHLMTKGYSWWWSTSNNLTLFEYVYKNGDGKKLNAHDETWKEIKRAVVDKKNASNDIIVNVKTLTEKRPYLSDEHIQGSFFGDNYHHYIIRHATGDELAKMGGGRYNKKTFISGFDNVFRYNEYYGITDLENNEGPETRDMILAGKYQHQDPVKDPDDDDDFDDDEDIHLPEY